MDRKRGLIRAGAIAAVALAAGHLGLRAWQAETLPETAEAPATDEALASRIEPVAAVLPPAATVRPAAMDAARAAPVPAAVAVDAVADTGEAPTAGPVPPDDNQMPAMTLATGPEPAEDAAAPTLAALIPPDGGLRGNMTGATDAATLPAAPDECAANLSLKAAPRAMIEVSLQAPCSANARVVIRHAGLAIAETLDDAGRLMLDLPALDTRGKVSALLPGAMELHNAVAIPEAAKLRRLAVQWIADDAFQLHGMEAGAGYGEPGDVFAGNPVSPSGGYLVALGDPASSLPMLAEVYTWPAGITVRPVIEAEVTAATCGRELMGETLMADRGTVTATDLTLAMPGCDALGDILVLNNLIGESRLALTED